jgi:hypothetical protein
VFASERVFHRHGRVRFIGPDAVNHESYTTERDAIDWLDAAWLFRLEGDKISASSI